VVIAQAVEQGDQLAGGGDDADVASAAGRDAVADLPQAGVRRDALHSLDRGPADQAGALLGDPATVHGRVGLAVGGVNPAQLASSAGRWKRPMSPISATNTAPSSGPTPGICWIAR
jgi:hypothetical protein